MLEKRNYPFLKNEELNTLQVDEAKKINEQRFLSTRNDAQRAFVEHARDLKNFADRKSEEGADEYQRYEKELGKTGAAVDFYLYNNPQIRMELNSLRSETPVGYGAFAHSAGESEFTRYLVEQEKFEKMNGINTRATGTSTDVPGSGNTLQTTVAQSIAYRVDKFDQVVSKVKKINLPYGNYDATKYNKYGLAGYMAEGASIPDTVANLTDATNGITKESYAGKQFGVAFRKTWLAGKRISASVINDEMKFAEMEFGRGEAFQILSGTGAGINDSGVTVVGTAATIGTDPMGTFSNAKKEVMKNNAFSLTAFMNAEAWAVYEKLSLTNIAYQNSQNAINLNTPTLFGVPVIVVSNAVMPTTTGVAKVVVGDFNDYIRFTNGGMEYLSGNEITTETVSTVFNAVSAWLMARDGGALFADSFSQFSLTV
jgi:hypothetical protein